MTLVTLTILQIGEFKFNDQDNRRVLFVHNQVVVGPYKCSFQRSLEASNEYYRTE